MSRAFYSSPRHLSQALLLAASSCLFTSAAPAPALDGPHDAAALLILASPGHDAVRRSPVFTGHDNSLFDPASGDPARGLAAWKNSAPPSAAEGPDPSQLESAIENYIKELRQRGLISSNERTSWLIYDLSADKKLVGINEDIPFQAASLIKPFLALAYFHEVAAGRKTYSGEARWRMQSMIRDSDNSAANWLLRRLGGPAAVQKLLRNNYGNIFGNTSIVEYIPRGGRTYRNKASANDYSRFLHALWNDNLPGSAEIKRLMNLPKRDRLSTAAPGVPEGTEVYDKTGTTSRFCGDMGILVGMREDGGRIPYIIVGVIEKDRSTRSYLDWMHTRGNIIRRISGMVYKELVGLTAVRNPLEENLSAYAGLPR